LASIKTQSHTSFHKEVRKKMTGKILRCYNMLKWNNWKLRRNDIVIRIEKINAKNIWDILKLHVSKEQESFVAPNELSIIEAYIAITGNGHAFPFGIFEDEIPVGFLMIGYDVDESFDNPPQIAYSNYSIWRLMIDEKYQS